MKVLINWKALCDETPNTTDTIIISGPGLQPGTYGIGQYVERGETWDNRPLYRFHISTFTSKHLSKSRYDLYSIVHAESSKLFWDYYNDQWQHPKPIESLDELFEHR